MGDERGKKKEVESRKWCFEIKVSRVDGHFSRPPSTRDINYQLPITIHFLSPKEFPHRLEVKILPALLVPLCLTFGNVGVNQGQFCFSVCFFQ